MMLKRVNNSQLFVSKEELLLLPPKHLLVTLFICNAHELAKHSGVSQTLTSLK